MASLFQFSIRSLLVAVTIACLGIAALLNANGWWETAVWSLALLTLASGLLLVIYRTNETRAFWVGYVVFGGLFIVALLCSVTIQVEVTDHKMVYIRPLYYSLPTTKLTQLVYQTVLPESRRQEQIAAPPPMPLNTYDVDGFDVYSGAVDEAAPIGAGAPDAMDVGVTTKAIPIAGSSGPVALSFGPIPGMPPPTVANPNYIPPGSFIGIGQALWLLFIAAAGGKICQLIYRTRPKAEQ